MNLNYPKALFQKFVANPVYTLRHKYLCRAGFQNACKNIANFVFDRSKETAVIMLVFNAISIVSSHIAQIGGLKKRNRENKDYLINQEYKELGLDLILTIIPPFLLNNFLMRKLDSGVWTTKKSRDNLIDIIAPTVGATRDELYNTDHIKTLKQTLYDMRDDTIKAIKKSGKLPKFIDERLKMPRKRFLRKIPMVRMEDITTDFDVIRKGQYRGFRNGKAFDEINGQRNGLLILATIGYTVIASNIIMPILKNKLSNYSYNKQLKKKGETPESIKRKKRFAYNKSPIIDENDSHVFNVFSKSDNSISNISENKLKVETATNRTNTFDTFKTLNKSQSNGLRI